MTTFRVTLDLTNIFNDYRKKAFVLIKPEWKNIECLQSHIINLFGLEHYIFLTNENGIVFPAAEHPGVIDKNDVLVVHKIDLDELLAPNPVVLDSESNESEEDLEMSNPPEPLSSNTKQLLPQSSIDLELIRSIKNRFVTKNVGKAPPAALNDVPAKRRRKRVRKRKNKNIKNDLNSSEMTPKSSKPSTFKQNGYTKPTTLWTNDPKNVHVRFSDNASVSPSTSSGSESDSSEPVPVKPCKFMNGQVVEPKKLIPIVRFWDAITQSYRQIEEEMHFSNRQSDTIQENPIMTTQNDRPNIPNLTIPSFIGPIVPSNGNATDDLTEAEVPSIAPVQTPTTAHPDGPNLEDLRKEICSLNLPKVVNCTSLKLSETIAFKLLRMDDQCQPTISEYIVGCVEGLSEDKNEIKIKIVAGKSEVGSQICKTVITEDNEVTIVEDDFIEVKFQDLYDPRFCFFTI